MEDGCVWDNELDLKETDGGTERILLTLGRVQWWAFADTMLNLGFRERQQMILINWANISF